MSVCSAASIELPSPDRLSLPHMKSTHASAPPYYTEPVLSLGEESAVTRLMTNLLKHLNSPILHSDSLRCAPLLDCVLLALNPQARGDENRANGKSEMVNCACSPNLFGVNSVGNILQNCVGSVLTDQKSVRKLRQHHGLARRCEKWLRLFSRRFLKPESLAASQPVSHSTFFETLVTTHLSIACQGCRDDRRPDTFPLII